MGHHSYESLTGREAFGKLGGNYYRVHIRGGHSHVASPNGFVERCLSDRRHLGYFCNR